MGLFEWLANRWTPTYEYREYYGNEMEYIAWESTAVGGRRGFLLGFPAGALLTVAVIGGTVITGLYTPPAPTAAAREAQREPTESHAATKELDALRAENQGLKTQVMDANPASQATTTELDALRKENQGLKTQVMQVKAAATCPPCQPQALTNARPPAPAVVAPPQRWPPAEPRGSPRPGVGPSDR